MMASCISASGAAEQDPVSTQVAPALTAQRPGLRIDLNGRIEPTWSGRRRCAIFRRDLGEGIGSQVARSEHPVPRCSAGQIDSDSATSPARPGILGSSTRRMRWDSAEPGGRRSRSALVSEPRPATAVRRPPGTAPSSSGSRGQPDRNCEPASAAWDASVTVPRGGSLGSPARQRISTSGTSQRAVPSRAAIAIKRRPQVSNHTTELARTMYGPTQRRPWSNDSACIRRVQSGAIGARVRRTALVVRQRFSW